MKFSRRTNWDLSENAYTLAVREMRAHSATLFDLTLSNPTACAFQYDDANILEPLSAPEALLYEPAPFGMAHAREAVVQYYRDNGARTSIDRVCLTTSTSEAYSFLFRLLCDTDDEVLVARPSYPLFDFIAGLDGVKLREYPLLYDGSWQIDLHALEQAITPKTRAVVVVHPNNPTGSYASRLERAALDEICSRRQLALIVDEVFLDHSIGGPPEPTFLSSTASALTFVLSGISKVCALPQMKLSWLVAHGPEDMVLAASERLEIIADTFLSVNAPTQFALPSWLASRHLIQAQLRERTTKNRDYLDAQIQGTHVNRLAVQGGWTAILRVPRHVNGVPYVQAAMERGVVLQPGEFYGLSEGHVVVSLLTPTAVWQRGIAELPLTQ